MAPAGHDLALSLGLNAGDPVLVGVFSPSRGIGAEPTNQSAVCVFSVADIEVLCSSRENTVQSFTKLSPNEVVIKYCNVRNNKRNGLAFECCT